MDISIIVPIYNESGSISKLYNELIQVMDSLKKSYEIILVDDGSTDDTLNVLNDILINARKNGVRLINIRFRKNFGKSTALQAGFRESTGSLIISLDGDLQDDPYEIPRFIEEIDQGYDLVSGWKFNRQDPLSKRVPSKIFNSITSVVTGVNLHDFNCCFKAYRREVVEGLNIYGELHRFIPVLVFYDGFKVKEVRVHHRKRVFGKSKYGLKRYPEGFFDLLTVVFLTRFFKKPLHFFGNFGLFSSFLGTLIIITLYIRKLFFGLMIGQYQFLFLLGVLLIVVGFQFFSIGLLAELMIKIGPKDIKSKYIKEMLYSYS